MPKSPAITQPCVAFDDHPAERVEQEDVEAALKRLFALSISRAFPSLQSAPETLIALGRTHDYQCNNAMGLAKTLSQHQPPMKMNPRQVGEALAKAMPENDLIESIEPTDQGFINITIRARWVEDAVLRVVRRGLQPPAVQHQKILVDFSSPNIAKEMHVGHLRSTIIGDTICRLLEFLGHEVHRINHVGDWGTQFGMLILYLKRQHPDFLENPPQISDLAAFYKLAKKQFDSDEEFKEQARLEVVKLQATPPDPTSYQAWQLFCSTSRREFQEVYDRLNVTLEERGESFYNPMIPSVLALLQDAGQLEDSDGAKIIVSKEEKSLSALTGKDLSRMLAVYMVDTMRDGTVAYHPNLLAALERANLLVKQDMPSAGEDGGAPVATLTVVLGKKETKPWAKFDPLIDMDKLANQIVNSSLYANKTLDPLLLEVLVARKAIRGPSVLVPRFAFPLIAQKSDGGYTYDTTDLAAMHDRFVTRKLDRVLYFTDVGQFEHFRMCAQVAEEMGWLKHAKWAHGGFGLVTGEDGKKLKTRSGETEKLKDLLDEAVERAYETLKAREETDRRQGHTEEEMRQLARKIGYGAVKYFDLKQNRTTDYGFSYDKMLDATGNTAVFLLYQYARICSIKRRANVSDDELAAVAKLELESPKEKALAICAFRFGSVLLKTSEDLCPHRLAEFAYDLVSHFSDFFQECHVVGHRLQNSRLLLCELTGTTLRKTLELLGIEASERM